MEAAAEGVLEDWGTYHLACQTHRFLSTEAKELGPGLSTDQMPFEGRTGIGIILGHIMKSLRIQNLNYISLE